MYRLLVLHRLDLPDDITDKKADTKEVERMYRDQEISLEGAEEEVNCIYYAGSIQSLAKGGNEMANKFQAEWSGSFPTLCYGEWSLYKNGEDISEYIPEGLRTSHMNTEGIYSRWHFNSDWIEEFYEYKDGISCDIWIKENMEWLKKFCDTEEDFESVYRAFNKSDFRPNSCGGCI